MRGGEDVKLNDYFDYDGNIPSVYTTFAASDISLPENNIKSEENLESVKTVSVLSAPAAPESDSEEKTELLGGDIVAAIEAFENMNRSKEELHKELEQKRAEHLKDVEAEKEQAKKEKAQEKKKDKKKTSPEKAEEEKQTFEAPDEKPEEAEQENVADRVKDTVRRIKERNEEKEVSKLKHFFIIVLLMILVIVIFTGVVSIFMRSINEENERAAKFGKNAAKVCARYSVQYGNANYENLYDTYKVEGYRLTGLCFVRELDFNNDGESELLLVYNKSGKYYNEVWGYGDGKEFKMLYSEPVAQSDDKTKDAYSLLYRSKNKYYIAKFDKDKLNSFSLMQLKHNSFYKKFSGEYEEKTKAYSVDGKDDTDAFERIKYSVLKEEKAFVDVDAAAELIDTFNRNTDGGDSPQEIVSLESAYYNIVQDYNKKYGVSRFVKDNGKAYIDGLAVVDLVDFDSDGNNELLLVYRKPVKVRDETARGENVTYEVDRYYCDVYRYSGNRAILTYTNEGLSNKLNNTTDTYYMLRNEKKKINYCLNSFTNTDYGNHITAVSAEYKFNGTEFVSVFKSSYTTDYGYSKYYLDGKSTDKSEFNEKGYMNPFFDGEREYDKEKYTVKYVQRKSADAGDLKGIPKETEQEIQTLNPSYSADIKE